MAVKGNNGRIAGAAGVVAARMRGRRPLMREIEARPEIMALSSDAESQGDFSDHAHYFMAWQLAFVLEPAQQKADDEVVLAGRQSGTGSAFPAERSGGRDQMLPAILLPLVVAAIAGWLVATTFGIEPAVSVLTCSAVVLAVVLFIRFCRLDWRHGTPLGARQTSRATGAPDCGRGRPATLSSREQGMPAMIEQATSGVGVVPGHAAHAVDASFMLAATRGPSGPAKELVGARN